MRWSTGGTRSRWLCSRWGCITHLWHHPARRWDVVPLVYLPFPLLRPPRTAASSRNRSPTAVRSRVTAPWARPALVPRAETATRRRCVRRGRISRRSLDGELWLGLVGKRIRKAGWEEPVRVEVHVWVEIKVGIEDMRGLCHRRRRGVRVHGRRFERPN